MISGSLLGRAVLADGFASEFFNGRVLRKVLPGMLREGAKNTLVFTLISFTGALLIGLGLALMRNSRRRWLRFPAAVFVDVFRGLPATLVIVFIGFGIPIALETQWPFGRLGQKYFPGCLALALVGGAYMSETIRAGIEAVPKGQMEAARSLGMPYGLAMRRVILPQAFRLNLGPLTNELALLFKDTSLLAILGTFAGGKELTKYARDAVNANSNTTPLVAAGIVYLLITLPLLRAVAIFERRSKSNQHRSSARA